MLDTLIEQFTYLGLFVVLFAGGLGAPIPEEAVIAAAGILSRTDVVRWWLALPTCVLGVLSGDVTLYWVGRYWGERILAQPWLRRMLNAERVARLSASYRRHGVKIVFAARHVMGIRAPAFLVAGVVRLPFWKFLAVDGVAAAVSVPLSFALAYFATHHLKALMADVRRADRWAALIAIVACAVIVALIARRHGRVLSRRLDAATLAIPAGPTAR